MVDSFLLSIILILIEDQLILFMFYLETRMIMACGKYLYGNNIPLTDIGIFSGMNYN